mgnify:CR=1 FL=1
MLAVVALLLLHGVLGGGVPVTGGLSCEIAGFNERGLNLGGASVVDRALADGLYRGFGVFAVGLV